MGGEGEQTRSLLAEREGHVPGWEGEDTGRRLSGAQLQRAIKQMTLEMSPTPRPPLWRLWNEENWTGSARQADFKG